MYRLIITALALVFIPSSSFAGMSSANYLLEVSVMDSTGSTKSSPAFNLLDSAGQPSPIGPSSSTGLNSNLGAGFLYGTLFTISMGNAIPNVITGLGDILNNQPLTKQESKKISSAIQFLQQALNAFALYQAGDLAALGNALNKTKNAINKLIASGVDTLAYQKMLAQAAELNVKAEVDRISIIAGNTDPNIIQARVFMFNASNELLAATYNSAVQSFVQAYNEALLAV